jgi:NADH-quinone oxidoreductase subunit H
MEIVILAVKVFIVFNVIMGLASLCTWVERKGSALIQDRIGANRAGAVFEITNPVLKKFLAVHFLIGAALFLLGSGFLTVNLLAGGAAYLPGLTASIVMTVLGAGALGVAAAPHIVRGLGILGVINTLLNDAVKALLKEDFVPEGTSNFMHCLAPFLAVFPVFLAFAIVPLAPDFEVAGEVIRAQVSSLDAGILFFLAMGSIAVYGVALAGWCGQNKFSLLGGLRASAQMISYELAMGIAIVSVIVVYGTMDLYQMVEAQKGMWGVVTQPIAFLILFVVGMAETKRGPFDLPESESELVAGYFTEYSGMKFLIFWLGEFAEIALFSLVLTLLFFGGWHLPFVELPANTWWAALIGHGILMGKVVFFCVLQIVIRWTLPRFRYDQLMNLGWKILLPLSMANLMVYAALKVGGVF